MSNSPLLPTDPADAYRALVIPCDLGLGSWRVASKDCIDIAGYPTRQGNAVLAAATPIPPKSLSMQEN